MDNKQMAMSMLNCSVDNNSLNFDSCNNFGINSSGIGTSQQTSCWDYWQNQYYPYVIYPSYPVYIQERAVDKGKKAFEIIKLMKDKKFVIFKTVKDFIDVMDLLINIL